MAAILGSEARSWTATLFLDGGDATRLRAVVSPTGTVAEFGLYQINLSQGKQKLQA
jgi:hypothetical protein